MKPSPVSNSFSASPSGSECSSRAYLRLRSSATKENLWLYILRMLLERPMYAYEIGKEISNRFGFSTATVTVYVVLYKLQRENLIQREQETLYQGRPARKYYTITDLGRQELSKGRKLLQDMLSILK
jgi:DNA-binding PadR family transcriptional regulator